MTGEKLVGVFCIILCIMLVANEGLKHYLFFYTIKIVAVCEVNFLLMAMKIYITRFCMK